MISNNSLNRYLAAGESMTDIMLNFRIGKSTVSKIILECCNCLWDVLNKDVSLSFNYSNK